MDITIMKKNNSRVFKNKYFPLLIQDASLASPNSDTDRRGATSPTKIRSDEEVETLQLTKKEKKSSLEEKAPSEIKIDVPQIESKPEPEPEKTEEKPAAPVKEEKSEEKSEEIKEPEKPAETENPPPESEVPEETKENGNTEEN